METKKKRGYERMSIIPISIEAGQPLLVGSKTGVNIEVQEVEVKEFENDTFPTGGFEASID